MASRDGATDGTALLGVMDGSPEPVTRSEWVERRMRAAIISGALRPGARINVPQLAAEWQVSPTPFREVIPRLASDGLVDVVPQRGVRVALMSEEDLLDIYAMRQLVEPHAVRLSAEQGDDDYRSRLHAAWEPLEQAYHAEPLDRVTTEQAHREFHLALIAASGSRWMSKISATLSDHAARYRILGTERRGGNEFVIAEHRRLLDACLAGDADRAEELLRNHLGLTVKAAMARLEEAEV